MTVTGKTASISDALSDRLRQLTLSPPRRVAWPGMVFTASVGEIYLEPRLLPNTTDFGAVGVNAPRRHRGLYQVTVYGPAIAASPEPQDEIVDRVIEHFVAQTITRNGVTVRIGSFDGSPSVPYPSSALIAKGWRSVAVTIPWWCDTW